MRSLFLILTVLTVFSCTNDEEILLKSEIEVTKFTRNNEGLLSENLINLGNYLREMNFASEGQLFNYMEENPNHSPEELEQMGYIEASIVSEMSEVIMNEVTLKSEEEIVESINYVGEIDGFSSSDNSLSIRGPGGKRFRFFRCVGCLDRIRHNHSIYIFELWCVGPGC